jgi:hypothetical protein
MIRKEAAPIPTAYEDRRHRLPLPLRNLVIWVPDRYDLFLMMSLRATRQDIEVIDEMHRASPFDLEAVVERCNGQTLRSFGNLEILEHVCFIIEKLFGPNRVHRIGALSMRQDFGAADGTGSTVHAE